MQPVMQFVFCLSALSLTLAWGGVDRMFHAKRTSSPPRFMSGMSPKLDPELNCANLKPTGRCAPEKYLSRALLYYTAARNASEVQIVFTYVFARAMDAPKNVFAAHMFSVDSASEDFALMEIIVDYNIQVAFLYWWDLQHDPHCISFPSSGVPDMIRGRCLPDNAQCVPMVLGMGSDALGVNTWTYNSSFIHNGQIYTELMVQEQKDDFVPVARYNLFPNEKGRIVASAQATFFNSTVDGVEPGMFVVPEICYKGMLGQDLDLDLVTAPDEVKYAFMAGLV